MHTGSSFFSLSAAIVASVAATALTGCGADPSPTPLPEGVSAELTYHADIAPILAAQCASCHQEGGIGSFRLQTYEDTKPLLGAIKKATAERTMPPYGVEASGACNTFKDARWLSDTQIATIGAWVDAGAPEGNPADSAGVTWPAPTHLEDVTYEVDMGVTYTPDATLTDDYRCFVVDPGVSADGFLTSYEVIPGEPQTVHHVILFSLHSAEADAEVEKHDADEPGPGYTCFGGAKTKDSGFLAAWAPGTRVTRYPEGTGLPVSAGRKMVLQVHYNLANGQLPDRTRLALHVEPKVERAAKMSGVVDPTFKLTPGMESVSAGSTRTVKEGEDVTVLGVFPHMHTLGRTLRVDQERAGETSCVVDVPAWDFHWQQFYFYEKPLEVKAGDVLKLACGFDTRGRTSETTWGEGTQDEMCLAGLYVVR